MIKNEDAISQAVDYFDFLLISWDLYVLRRLLPLDSLFMQMSFDAVMSKLDEYQNLVLGLVTMKKKNWIESV